MSYRERRRKWRREHPKKRRDIRNTYYRNHVYGEPHTRKRYTIEEDALILTKQLNGKHIFDRDIAKKIKRSIKGIQVHRSILRKEI